MIIGVLTLLLTGLLSGCVIAPGMSMRALPEESLEPPEVPGVKVSRYPLPLSATMKAIASEPYNDEGDMTQNVLLQDGDILHVPDRSRQKVFVIGEFEKPSSLIIPQRGMSLTEANGDAGGVDRLTSDPVHMYVIRGTEKQSQIYYLNAYSPDALVLGDRFRLKARDIVYVETAPVTRWSRVIEQLLPGALGRAFLRVASEAQQHEL